MISPERLNKEFTLDRQAENCTVHWLPIAARRGETCRRDPEPLVAQVQLTDNSRRNKVLDKTKIMAGSTAANLSYSQMPRSDARLEVSGALAPGAWMSSLLQGGTCARWAVEESPFCFWRKLAYLLLPPGTKCCSSLGCQNCQYRSHAFHDDFFLLKNLVSTVTGPIDAQHCCFSWHA